MSYSLGGLISYSLAMKIWNEKHKDSNIIFIYPKTWSQTYMPAWLKKLNVVVDPKATSIAENVQYPGLEVDEKQQV